MIVMIPIGTYMTINGKKPQRSRLCGALRSSKCGPVLSALNAIRSLRQILSLKKRYCVSRRTKPSMWGIRCQLTMSTQGTFRNEPPCHLVLQQPRRYSYGVAECHRGSRPCRAEQTRAYAASRNAAIRSCTSFPVEAARGHGHSTVVRMLRRSSARTPRIIDQILVVWVRCINEDLGDVRDKQRWLNISSRPRRSWGVPTNCHQTLSNATERAIHARHIPPSAVVIGPICPERGASTTTIKV